MALSATCPPLVREDLLKLLDLPAIVDGRSATVLFARLVTPNEFADAGREGTVFFSAPLYRKNLHYTVVPKSSNSANMTKVMVDYILEHHPNDTGIVYCLSKKVR
jgi:ATP-dependent DNA helicase Q1